MNMIIAISMAPQNGWETWFSLNMGTNLAKLAVRIPQLTPRNLAKDLKDQVAVCKDATMKADPKKPATKNTPVYVELAK
jgi:hypothetical protein